MLLAIAFAPRPLEADHAWGSFHWERSANPVVIGIGDNVSDLWVSHLDQAVADWNQSSALDLAIE